MTRKQLEKAIDDIAIKTGVYPTSIKMREDYLEKVLAYEGVNYRLIPRHVWYFEGLPIIIDNDLTTGFEVIYEIGN